MTRECHVRFFEKGVYIPIGPAQELRPYSPSLCTLLFLGGWLPILDIPILRVIPGSIRFSIKVLLLLFVYIWVRAAFPRYRYDQLMRLGWKVFLPLSLAWVVFVSGVPITFDWLPRFIQQFHCSATTFGRPFFGLVFQITYFYFVGEQTKGEAQSWQHEQQR